MIMPGGPSASRLRLQNTDRRIAMSEDREREALIESDDPPIALDSPRPAPSDNGGRDGNEGPPD